ncbi:MAG: hypothetical protein WCP21_22730, partial [Armatimonadota bacterium]
MRRTPVLLLGLLASVASAHPRRPYTIDEPRVKTVVADFLGVPAARINWKCIAPPDGPANWYHPID